MPLHDLTAADLETRGVVLQIGVAPICIDILTHVDGFAFDEPWPGRVQSTLAGLRVAVLSREHLMANKRTVGGLQDFAVVARLLGGGDAWTMRRRAPARHPFGPAIPWRSHCACVHLFVRGDRRPAGVATR